MPPAKPAALKLLNGRGPGKDSAGRVVPTPPKFMREAPEAPEWLNGEALVEWNRIVPELEALDLLKSSDRATLAAYCETWSRYISAVREYQRDGVTVINPDSGRIGKHPAVAVAEAAGAQLRSFANDFGLSPAGERNLASTPKVDENVDDPFAGRSRSAG